MGATKFALVFDNGYHEDVYDKYPPQAEIDDARRAAPDAWTTVEQLVDGWESQVLHEWPPLEHDPR